MNVLGHLAVAYMPGPVRKALLARLFADTAAAFGRPAPPLRGLSVDQTLIAFRDFTAHPPVDRGAYERLFRMAHHYGTWLRWACGVASTEDAMTIAQAVYRVMGIEFRGGADGEITISRCFFSNAYSPEICKLMSALDTGLLAGLSHGGLLAFSQRITEGHPSCLARLA